MNNENFKRQSYKTNPLLEVLCEVRFFDRKFDSVIPGRFYDKVSGLYPIQEDVKLFSFHVGKSDPSIENQQPQIPLLKLWKPDKKSLLQIGPGIFSANSLKYQSWEEFVGDIEFGLKEFLDISSKDYVQRVGTRFINRFIFDETEVELSKYFNFGLMPPSPLKNSNAFEVSFLNSRIQAKTNMVFESKVKFSTDALKSGENGVAFLLDIDTFSNVNSPKKLADILSVATSCHDYSSEIFESFLKPSLREKMGLLK